MRQRPRSPILYLLQLAIFGVIFWQVSRALSTGPAEAPATMFDSTVRTMRLVIIGIVAMAALNLLYPLAVWGAGRLRERQADWSPDPDRAVATASDAGPVHHPSHCPGCGASLFDEAPACPWCGHPLDAAPAPG